MNVIRRIWPELGLLVTTVLALCLLGGQLHPLPEEAETAGPAPQSDRAPEAVDVPILLYHHLDRGGEGGSTIDPDTFLSHLDWLRAEGYQTVTMDQLIAYGEEGTPLPDKPVAITFDDGYCSNYEIAWPALEERGMVGTIFVIGCSVGRDTYKDTGKPMIPHFTFEQAREMMDSGVMDIQSHTYDMHQYRPLEPDGGREGVRIRPEESREDYLAALRADLTRSAAEIQAGTGRPVRVLAYPFGLHTEESEQVCGQLDIPATLTTVMAPAHLVRGDAASLRLMSRFSIDDCTPEQLKALITAQPGPA